jgi:hypothetical protein
LTSGNTEDASDSGIAVLIPEASLEYGEGRFSRAVTRGDAVELPLVVQGGGDSLNFRVRGLYQVKTSK